MFLSDERKITFQWQFGLSAVFAPAKNEGSIEGSGEGKVEGESLRGSGNEKWRMGRRCGRGRGRGRVAALKNKIMRANLNPKTFMHKNTVK